MQCEVLCRDVWKNTKQICWFEQFSVDSLKWFSSVVFFFFWLRYCLYLTKHTCTSISKFTWLTFQLKVQQCYYGTITIPWCSLKFHLNIIICEYGSLSVSCHLIQSLYYSSTTVLLCKCSFPIRPLHLTGIRSRLAFFWNGIYKLCL